MTCNTRRPQGGQAALRGSRNGPRTQPPTPAQRRPVRMGRPKVLARVDLPVDVVVVLEQDERAGQTQGTERALGKR